MACQQYTMVPCWSVSDLAVRLMPIDNSNREYLLTFPTRKRWCLQLGNADVSNQETLTSPTRKHWRLHLGNANVSMEMPMTATRTGWCLQPRHIQHVSIYAFTVVPMHLLILLCHAAFGYKSCAGVHEFTTRLRTTSRLVSVRLPFTPPPTPPPEGSGHLHMASVGVVGYRVADIWRF